LSWNKAAENNGRLKELKSFMELQENLHINLYCELVIAFGL